MLAGDVDAAHATNLITRHSITGLVFMFGGVPLTDRSKIQLNVILASSTSIKAEFIAATHASKLLNTIDRSLLSLVIRSLT